MNFVGFTVSVGMFDGISVGLFALKITTGEILGIAFIKVFGFSDMIGTLDGILFMMIDGILLGERVGRVGIPDGKFVGINEGESLGSKEGALVI